jgi:hypothetical protein
VQDEQDQHIERDMNNFSLEDMELKEDIDKMFPNINQLGWTTHQSPSLEIIENDTFDDEESFTF